MPNAVTAGMSYKEFMHSTPKYISIKIKEYEKRIVEKSRYEKYLSWLNGVYVLDAISAAFGGKYPKNPLEDMNEEKENENTESHEEVGVFEMQQRIRLLREQGLPESPD